MRLGLPTSRKILTPSTILPDPAAPKFNYYPIPVVPITTMASTSAIPAYRANPGSPSTSRKAAKASATASAPSSRAPTRSSTSDPYYGHEETSVMSARFITSLFACPNIPSVTTPGAPTPTLAHFVAYALHRTRLPSIVTFAALLLLQRLKTRFPAARGSSGHRLFISAFMIASKVICDDTYSNQSWGIVAQKMFALKEINQMEREMCGYLEWNLNVAGEEVLEFEARIRAEHGPTAVAKSGSSSSSSSSDGVIIVQPPSASYPSPETTPDPQTASRPIRPVPSPYKNRVDSRNQYRHTGGFPSPPRSPPRYLHASHIPSPQPPHFASANSSLASSPASDDCKTPSPVALASSATGHHHSHHPVPSRTFEPKAVDMSRAFEGRSRQHGSSVALSGYPIDVGGW